MGFPAGASGKEPTCQCRRSKRLGFDPWVRKIPWRRAWQPTPVFLPGESHGQRSVAGYSPWGRRESNTTKWLSSMPSKCRWDISSSLFSFLDSDHPMNGLEEFWMNISAFCSLARALKQSASWTSAQQGCSCVYSCGYLPVAFSETSSLIFKTDQIFSLCPASSPLFFFTPCPSLWKS